MVARGGAALLALPMLALLLLAAHFVHAGLWPVAAACVAAIALVWVGKPWAARGLQVLLAGGAIEWVLTAAMIAQLRITHQQPYLRMLLILGSVAVFTVLAALAFQHPSLARRFGLVASRGEPSPPSG
jgi:hypothetical protein